VYTPADLHNRNRLIVIHLLGELQPLFVTEGRLRPAALFPPGSGGCEPSVGSLPDDIPFKFCERPENMEDQFSTAGGGVDVFGQAFKADVPIMELSESFDQVFDRVIAF
jgi:hypothetical protein